MLAKNVLKYRFCTKSIDKVIGTVNSETADKDIRPTVVRTYPLSEFKVPNDGGYFFQVPRGTAEGLPKRLDASLEDSMSEHWMLRESTRNLMSQLKHWPNAAKHLPSCVVLDGEAGTGKSVALKQIAEYCKSQNWLVIYIPDGRSWTHSPAFVKRSERFKGKFDLEDEFVISFLKQVIKVNGDKLGVMDLSQDYENSFDEFEKPFKGKTVLDLMNYGIDNPDSANTALVYMRNELAKTTQFKVLLAVDEYNWWHFPTVFGFRLKPVTTDDIVPIRAMKHLVKDGVNEGSGFANGLSIYATTYSYPCSYDLKEHVNYAKLCRKFRKYSEKELENYLRYFNEKDFFGAKFDEKFITHMHLMTLSNPNAVSKRILTQ